jgi:MYXO-CTERM domain-containing protein
LFPLGDDANLVLVQVPLKQGSSSVQFVGSAFCYASGAVSAGVNGGFFLSCLTSRDPASVSALKARDNISARPFFTDLGVLAVNDVYSNCHARGQFGDRGIHLLGFKFNNGGGVQYGWARLKMLGRPFNRMQLIDYAYADPAERISAGQKSKDSAPAMESLGGLALGAAGLLAWRRRRSVRLGAHHV